MCYVYNNVNVYTSMHEVASLVPLFSNILTPFFYLLSTLYSLLDVHGNEILFDSLDIDTNANIMVNSLIALCARTICDMYCFMCSICIFVFI